MLSFICCPCPPQPFLCGYLSAETFSLNIFDYFANLWTFFLTFKKYLKIHSILKKFLISPSPQSEQRILTVRAVGGVEKRPAPFTGFRIFGAQHAGLASGRVLGGPRRRVRFSPVPHAHLIAGWCAAPPHARAAGGGTSALAQGRTQEARARLCSGSCRLQQRHVSVLFTSHWSEKVTW